MSYYNRAHGCFLVFDVADRDSFLNSEDFLMDIFKNAPDYISIILIGNKSDLLHMREVTFEEAAEFAKNNDMIYIESSALAGYGREEMINIMVSSIQNKINNGQNKSVNLNTTKKHLIWR